MTWCSQHPRLEHVAERCHWHCGICGRHVDRRLPENDPWAASVDHLIPRAIGGPDVLWNLQLAHRTCNSRRQARLTRAERMLLRDLGRIPFTLPEIAA